VSCTPSSRKLIRVSGCALAFALAVMVWPNAARAFCRTSTCTDCPRDPPTGCTIGGRPIAWPHACVSFSLSQSASDSIDVAAASVMMGEAFAVWESARCGSDEAAPSIRISPAFGPAVCAKPQYNPESGNANLVVFRDRSWPYTSKNNELAATTLTFDGDGVIYDADVEINATGPLHVSMSENVQAEPLVQFGIIPDQHDLLSIMIHEAGHFLGLDHSREEGSIMLAELAPGEVRTQLTADDVAAICEAYPPDRVTPACDFEPRGGFASACDSSPVSGGCSLQPQAHTSGLGFTLLASLLSVLKIRRARRRNGR
jgi:hypothetical protein